MQTNTNDLSVKIMPQNSKQNTTNENNKDILKSARDTTNNPSVGKENIKEEMSHREWLQDKKIKSTKSSIQCESPNLLSSVGLSRVKCEFDKNLSESIPDQQNTKPCTRMQTRSCVKKREHSVTNRKLSQQTKSGEHTQRGVCKKGFNNNHDLLAHNGSSGESFNCNTCFKLFNNFSDLRQHKKKHSVRFCCSHCSKTMLSLRNYTEHMDNHAEQGICVLYKCAHCSEAFDNSKLLISHNRIHRKKHVAYIPCPWTHCSKMFTCQSRLNQHVKRHNGEKVYLCSRCGMLLTDCVLYKKHRSTCRQRFIKLSCKLCGKECGGYSALKTHTRTHTGEKPFPCDVCGRGFKINHHLKRHRLTHFAEPKRKRIPKCSSQLQENSTQTPIHFETVHVPSHFVNLKVPGKSNETLIKSECVDKINSTKKSDESVIKSMNIENIESKEKSDNTVITDGSLKTIVIKVETIDQTENTEHSSIDVQTKESGVGSLQVLGETKEESVVYYITETNGSLVAEFLSGPNLDVILEGTVAQEVVLTSPEVIHN